MHKFPPQSPLPDSRMVDRVSAILLFYKATGTSLLFAKGTIDLNYPSGDLTPRVLGELIRDYYYATKGE